MLRVSIILEAAEGGTRRHVRDLVRGLAAKPSAFRVSVICSTRRDPGMEDDIALFRSLGADVSVVPMRRSIAPFSDLACSLSIARLLRRLRPDIVHTHSSKAGLCGRLAVRLLPRRARPLLVHTPHGFAFDIGGPGRGGGLFRFLARRWERLARRWTDLLVCVSDHERRQALALGYGASAVALVRNGVDPRPDAAPSPLSRPPRVRLFGRVCPQKGQEVLAAALRALRASSGWPATGLDVAVYGTLPRRVPRALREAERDGLLRLAGPLRPEEALREIAASDIVAIPSNWEAMPYVLLEALAAGRRVVASSVGGIPEIVENGLNGLLVPPGDPSALAAALARLLGDPPPVDPAARPVPTREAMVERMEEIYTWLQCRRSPAC